MLTPSVLPVCPAEKQVYTWTSDTSNNTYMLNTEPANATAAQQFCNDNGAHLVSWYARHASLSALCM